MYYSFFKFLLHIFLRVWAVDTEEKLQFYFKRITLYFKENFKDTQIFEKSFYLFDTQHSMFCFDHLLNFR